MYCVVTDRYILSLGANLQHHIFDQCAIDVQNDIAVTVCLKSSGAHLHAVVPYRQNRKGVSAIRTGDEFVLHTGVRICGRNHCPHDYGATGVPDRTGNVSAYTGVGDGRSK